MEQYGAQLPGDYNSAGIKNVEGSVFDHLEEVCRAREFLYRGRFHEEVRWSTMRRVVSGYLTTLIGFLAGAIPVAGLVAFGLWNVFAIDWGRGCEGLGCVIVAVMVGGLVIGIAVGGYLAACMTATLGCWLALRWRRHPYVRYTVVALVFCLFIHSALLVIVIATGRDRSTETILFWALGLEPFVAPILARTLALLTVELARVDQPTS